MSMSYNEIKALKAGDKFCEAGYMMSVWYEILEDINEKADDKYTQLSWKGKNVETGEVTDFLITKNLEHYGPKIYLYDPYFRAGKDLDEGMKL